MLQYELVNINYPTVNGKDGQPLQCNDRAVPMPTSGAAGLKTRLLWNATHRAYEGTDFTTVRN